MVWGSTDPAARNCCEWCFKKWDDDTANHGSVCVQEHPGKTTFLDYNRAKVAGDPRLAPVTQSAMPYATVGSGHINQVLRNILGSALADSVQDAVDADGRINRRLIAAHDPSMAAACE